MLLLPLAAMAQLRINMRGEALRKLQIAEMAINNLYVDTVYFFFQAEDGIRGMLEKLDPHSSYLTAKEVEASNEPLQGNFEGIGVQFNMSEDTLLVIQPVVGGPSEKKGIMAGDRIVTVNDTAIAGVKATADAAVVANASITGGTATKVTFDSKGLITGSSSLVAEDIPNIAIS
mgnify:CR=1 FL=1